MLQDDHDAYLSINDLTPEAAWATDLSSWDQEWLKSIAALEPEQFLLTDQLRNQPRQAAQKSEPILDRDLHGWRSGRYIGDIHHQGRTLRIRPRLGIDTIAGWLSTIHNVQILPEVAGLSHSHDSLVTQLAAAMWRATVLKAGRHSLARDKASRKTTGLQIKGKLNVPATSRLRSTGKPEIASTITYRTLDTPTNAAIVAADRVLSSRMGNPRWRGPRISEQITALRQAVGNNPRLPSKFRLNQARYTPINLKWREAAELSHRIASNRLLHRNTTSSSTYGLLIDVAELWERFVLHCTTQATDQTVIHGSSATLEQHLLHSAIEPQRGLGRLYPDIVINPTPDRTTCTALIDAKYKPLTDWRGVDREDLYQIHAYSLRFKPAKSLLAYPHIPDPGSYTEKFSPWTSHTGSQLDFLRLPTRETECIKLLRQWLTQSNTITTHQTAETPQNH